MFLFSYLHICSHCHVNAHTDEPAALGLEVREEQRGFSGSVVSQLIPNSDQVIFISMSYQIFITYCIQLDQLHDYLNILLVQFLCHDVKLLVYLVIFWNLILHIQCGKSHIGQCICFLMLLIIHVLHVPSPLKTFGLCQCLVLRHLVLPSSKSETKFVNCLMLMFWGLDQFPHFCMQRFLTFNG